uniref:Uncharacterized protein n=1 Tax=Romanomermis culicivorax TaxID=13658 RepID=A0A915JCQ8_ROMCU
MSFAFLMNNVKGLADSTHVQQSRAVLPAFTHPNPFLFNSTKIGAAQRNDKPKHIFAVTDSFDVTGLLQ